MSGHSGDFRLLNPFPVLRDEDGVYHCPMPSVRTSWRDDDTLEYTKVLCGEPLHLRWTLYCTVPDHDGPDAVMETKDAGGWAESGSWELWCETGHVIASGVDAGGEHVPYDGRLIFGEQP